jgi:hypothetical protein
VAPALFHILHLPRIVYIDSEANDSSDMSQFVDVAWQRVKAAYSTVPPALDPTAWLYIATFAALAIPIGMFTGVLNFKIEKRPSKWLEVSYCCASSELLLPLLCIHNTVCTALARLHVPSSPELI